MQDAAQMLSLFNSPTASVDFLTWQQGDLLSVSSCYSALEFDGFLVFPHKSIWSSKIPQQVAFMVCGLYAIMAPTLDTLNK